MHRIKLSIGFIVLGLASSLFAAQYEFPVDSIATTNPARANEIGTAGLARMKELSRFPMELFEAGPEIGGKVRYQLPKVLTGKTVDITMSKISEVDGIRTYNSEDGVAQGSCTGPLAAPTCSIKLAGLDLKNAANVALRNKEIDASYRDPASRQSVRNIADLFMEQMPIGIILGDAVGQLPTLLNRWWSGNYTVNGKPMTHDLCFYQKDGRTEGHFRVGKVFNDDVPCGQCPGFDVSFCGDILNLKIVGEIMTGTWQVPNTNGRGWVEFQFNKSLGFKGTYGQSLQSSSQGTWAGQLK